MLVDFGEEEKNWAILFVVLDVEDERFRVEAAMIGTAGVVAVEEEKRFGFRGISCELRWVRIFPHRGRSLA